MINSYSGLFLHGFLVLPQDFEVLLSTHRLPGEGKRGEGKMGKGIGAVLLGRLRRDPTVETPSILLCVRLANVMP